MSSVAPSGPASPRRNHALWIGPLIAFAGLVSYFLVFARWPSLRDFPWVNLPLVLLGAAVSLLGAWRAWFRPNLWRGRLLGSVGLALSLLLAIVFNGYVFVLSSMLPEAAPLTMELARAPEFALTDQHGETRRLSDFKGRRVVITFFRGFW